MQIFTVLVNLKEIKIYLCSGNRSKSCTNYENRDDRNMTKTLEIVCKKTCADVVLQYII